MARYSFQDWLKGEPENWEGNPFDKYDFPESRIQVIDAKIEAFQKIVEINFVWITRFIHKELEKIEDLKDRLIFLNSQLEIYESKIGGISRVKIIQGPYEWDLKFIDSVLYHKAMNFEIPEKGAFITLKVENDLLNASIAHKVIRRIEDLIESINSEINLSPTLTLEELRYLSHKITLLYELGIIDLLKQRLQESNNLTATNLANLIGIIIDNNQKKDVNSIRKALSYIETNNKKNPINADSIKAVKKILIDLDLKPQKI
ncbi:hypothetical protein [Shivajiella indica]|uniref:Uncharacterized protein n=1 Tax=Shivajiella indica TaxID=872115 RepID=A0ABW5B5E3_9BACT